jgi:hypothetical protein
MAAENEAEILSETDKTDTEDDAEHSPAGADPEVQRSEADSSASSSGPSESSSRTRSASPTADPRGCHMPGGDQPSPPNATPPRRASGQSNQHLQLSPVSTPPRVASADDSNQSSSSQSAPLSSGGSSVALLMGAKLLLVQILKIPMPQVLMLKLLRHHRHLLESVLGYRKVYVIQSNILTVQSDMVCFLLQVNHIILQKP